MVDRLAEQTNLSRTDAERALQCMLDTMIDWLATGDRIEFREFGVIETRKKKSHTAQNPKTLTPVFVKARRTVKFKPGKRMRDEFERHLGEDENEGGGEARSITIEPKPDQPGLGPPKTARSNDASSRP